MVDLLDYRHVRLDDSSYDAVFLSFFLLLFQDDAGRIAGCRPRNFSLV